METTQRQTYLDWLRIISIALVLLFHSAMPYVAEDGWHIKNHETSYLMMETNHFLHLVRMPLLFFISGTVSYFMMQRRTSMQFIGLRFRRLFIPLLVGMFIIVPPQIYMERLNNGFKGTYWDFYKTVFNFVPYPKGSFSWHHLWFIAYLFIYDIVFAPVFAWMASPKSIIVKQKLMLLAEKKWIYLIALPAIIWYTCMVKNMPETNDLFHDGCYFVYWLFFVLAGFVCIVQPKLMDSLEVNRRFPLTMGFLSFILLNYLRWNKIEPGHGGWPFPGDQYIQVFFFLQATTAWGWVLAFIGYGKKYLNHKLPVLDYLNQAVYPFYILHQTVIVVLVYYVVETPNESILSKYLFTVAATFFVTTLTYHLLVKPFPIMRFLFGMKPLPKKRPQSLPEKEKTGEAILLSV